MKWGDLSSAGLYPPSKMCDPAVWKLAVAVLLQAYRDATAPVKTSDKRGAIWRKDALQWLFADGDDPGGFGWVCDILEMQPASLRAWLRIYSRGNRMSENVVTRLGRFQIRPARSPLMDATGPHN